MILGIILFDDLNDNVFVTIAELFFHVRYLIKLMHYIIVILCMYVYPKFQTGRCRENKQIKYNS